MASNGKCEIKRRLFGNCGAPTVGLCQYCGTPFCAQHGELLEDHQEVCSRQTCVDKKVDVALHVVYKNDVRLRNEAGACGIADCVTTIEAHCVRCLGLFCLQHVTTRQEYVNDGRDRAPHCSHCWTRRPLWLKV